MATPKILWVHFGLPISKMSAFREDIRNRCFDHRRLIGAASLSRHRNLKLPAITKPKGHMFKNWQLEKAVQALIDEAEAMADRLGSAKPHVAESYGAAAQFWAVTYLNDGQDLRTIGAWKQTEVKRFIGVSQTKIAALRKKRDYVSSDGLAVWLHTARAVVEVRVRPPVIEIWRLLTVTENNSEAMANELLLDAGLPPGVGRSLPTGFF
jgi:hypothetical protein